MPLPAQPARHRWRRRLLWVGALIALAAGVYFLIPWVFDKSWNDLLECIASKSEALKKAG
jgi:hypothetical protein